MKRALLIILCTILCCSCSAKVKKYKVEVVKEYPHAVSSYTQGLFFHNGELYESSGQYGESSFAKVDLATGKRLVSFKFAGKYFAEGSCILGDKLYVLTWQNKAAFVYDAATLKYQSAYSYPREGWGLTTNGKELIASDGSSVLFFMTPEFKVTRRLKVLMDGRPVNMLNELEYIDGRIWANIYTSDLIVVINPEDGRVEKLIDCSNLLPAKLRKPETDVLNGIAYQDGHIYLTGKYWPRMYEVRLVEQK